MGTKGHNPFPGALSRKMLLLAPLPAIPAEDPHPSWRHAQSFHVATYSAGLHPSLAGLVFDLPPTLLHCAFCALTLSASPPGGPELLKAKGSGLRKARQVGATAHARMGASLTIFTFIKGLARTA